MNWSEIKSNICTIKILKYFNVTSLPLFTPISQPIAVYSPAFHVLPVNINAFASPAIRSYIHSLLRWPYSLFLCALYQWKFYLFILFWQNLCCRCHFFFWGGGLVLMLPNNKTKLSCHLLWIKYLCFLLTLFDDFACYFCKNDSHIK